MTCCNCHCCKPGIFSKKGATKLAIEKLEKMLKDPKVPSGVKAEILMWMAEQGKL